ncbi:MAP7 domain-containing protein 2-like isoform X1 [Carassius carassius]|uniref:MAP7 domain-containing protein 2-like isoform X1 n=1 Tax=Carassius carassius TaxID=217509 RepID=UPI0028693ACA|nr:MAP7 domain-containing protein 2-like isoform X1 [Carassius carassius]XP_059390762.1 MAP7 domain-containing protein 2-like isoform X1 [Carassius carassius]
MATIVENLTDGGSKKDRIRLARDKREEKDRSKAVRERALLEKERRAQQQYERSLVERGKRLEEQRRKEMLRRSAVEEKRRQHMEEEKERLEALMQRSMGRNLQADQRPKRWTWGGPPGGCEGDPKIAPPSPAASASLANELTAYPPASKSRNVQDFMISPESPDSILIRHLSSSSTTLPNVTEKASSSPHRSPYRASPSRSERKKVSTSFYGQLDDPRAATTPKSPQTEKPEKNSAQTLAESSMKKLESPTTPTQSSSTHKNPSTPKRSKSCKSRIQSPATGQYPTSPMKHRATTPCLENKRWEGEEKGSMEIKGYSTLERKTSRTEKITKSTSKEFGHNAESPVTPTGKAGTTDAEEASRLLTERRRLARVQKEQEEKQRLEKERLRAEELQRQQEEERQWQEQAAREAEEKRQRQEEERCQRELEDRHQREQRWKELQDELVRQREEALQRVHREAERKRQERELLKIQEEQERLQRKKRIEEIMKRTRKPDGEKKEVQVEVPSPISVSRSISPSSLETEAGNTVIISPPKATSESPDICLVPLEIKSCGADDLSDGVQSMDVSPVSREELVPEYSPISEISQNSMTSVALDDIHVLTGQVSHPKVSAAPAFGDCNKNLIQDCNSTAIDSSLFQSLRPTSDKLNI